MFNRAAIAGAVIAVIAAGAGLWFWLSHEGDPQRLLDIRIGKIRMAIPAAYVHEASLRRSGEFTEVELAANVLNFRAAPRSPKLPPGVEDALQRIVFISMREQEGGLDPAERLPRLYARFLVPEAGSHPGGLILRRFEAGSPYQHEELFLAPPEGRMFTARCLRPRKPHDGLPNTCISQIRMAGLDIRLRFSPTQLENWEALMSGVRGLIQSQLR